MTAELLRKVRESLSHRPAAKHIPGNLARSRWYF
jgi:hypothetical protein